MLYLKGPLWLYVATRAGPGRASMSFEQVKIAWAMLLVQGGRRMYECLTFSTEKEFGGRDGEKEVEGSQMWVGHWVIGLLFYAGLSVGVWVEGVRESRLTAKYEAYTRY